MRTSRPDCYTALLAVALWVVCSPCFGEGSRTEPERTTLQVAPEPGGVVASAQYTVHLVQGEHALASFVYQTLNPGFLPDGQPSGIVSSSTLEHATSWTSFSFSGTVVVEVTNSASFTSARVLPSHAHIVPAVFGNTVSFALDRPGQFAVDFCTTGAECTEANDTNLVNPMLVFANPIDHAAPDPEARDVLAVPAGLSVPSGSSLPRLGPSQNTLYFGPGVYDLGSTPLTVSSYQTVYLAHGAYVKGFFAFAPGAREARIRGRGILSGENVPRLQCIGTAAGCPDMILGAGKVTRLLVEGITLIDSPFYNVSINGGSANRVDNVKVLAWLANSDGIQASFGAQDTGSVIENSFVKTGDDAIKLSGSNLLVRHCVVWKLNNAAAFQMGAGIRDDLTNITVRDSDVIRTEYNWPSMSNAVFAANQGGSGHLSRYRFDDIRIENSDWQLFKILVVPSNFQRGNDQLGSIRDLRFRRIRATDAQRFAPIFRGYDPAHPVANVDFDDVVIGGVEAPSPVPDFDANRNISYAGNTVGDLLLRDTLNPEDFAISIFAVPTPATGPQYSLTALTQPNLTGTFEVQASGDFYGDGYASAVVTDTVQRQIGIWKEPLPNSGNPWNTQFATIYALADLDGTVAGTGDFNGDGYSDILLWNDSMQAGKVLLIQGERVIGQQAFTPATASSWFVAAIADFDGDGTSDVLLRDAAGNLEVVYFNGASSPTVVDYKVSTLYYGATADYAARYGATSGIFDANWNVAGAGIFQTLGTEYAQILWINPASGQLGFTTFTPFQKTPFFGQVFAKLPAGDRIQAIADFNGDGAKDLLLWNSGTGQNAIWLMNYDGGALYQVGPTLQPALPSGFQVVPN